MVVLQEARNQTAVQKRQRCKTEEVWGGTNQGQDEICGDPDGKYTIGVVIHTTTDFLCAKLQSIHRLSWKSIWCKI